MYISLIWSMIHFFKVQRPSYHPFTYTPQRYNEKAQVFQKKREELIQKFEKKEFDILQELEHRKKKRRSISQNWIYALLFGIVILFSGSINEYLITRYRHGQIGIYFLLILLGFLFIKSSKKKNV